MIFIQVGFNFEDNSWTVVGGLNLASLGQEEGRSNTPLTTHIIGERRGRVIA